MDAPERKQLYSGFGDGMSRAFEMAATPAIIAGLGWLVDRAAGTSPLFTLVFFALGVIGIGIRTWYAYDLDMRTEEARLLGEGAAESDSSVVASRLAR